MFTIDGKTFSLEELQAAARSFNMDFDTYLNKMKAKGLKEVSVEKKEMEPVATDATAVPKNFKPFYADTVSMMKGELPKNTELNSETGFSDLPKNDTDPKPKPKPQKETPQITLDILKDEDEDDIEADVRAWFAENGLSNDFTVKVPTNPFAEKIEITSNQTGESFEYIKSVSAVAGRPFSTSIEELNNWIYQNGRHIKGEAQSFYKETGSSLTEAPDTVSDEALFNSSAYVQNFKNASLKAEKQVETLLNTNQFKKYSDFSLSSDPEKIEEYIEEIYDVLDDNNQFDAPEYAYFNKEGKKKIIRKSFNNAIATREYNSTIGKNIAFGNYLKSQNIPETKKDSVAFSIAKNTYSLSLKNDKNAQLLFNYAKQEKDLQANYNKAVEQGNSEEAALLKVRIDNLNKERKKIDEDFVTLSDKYTGKIIRVSEKNFDRSNTEVTNISDLVKAYSTQYSLLKNNLTGLDKKAAEIGKEVYANNSLGEKIIPYVTFRGHEFTNIKIKDLYKAYYDKTNGKLVAAITGFSDASFKDKQGNEIRGKIDQYYDKQEELSAKLTAIGDLVFLNRSTEGQAPGFFKSIAEGFVESLPVIGGKENLTTREKLNLEQSMLESTNVKLTEGMKKAAVPTLSEDLGTGIGASVIPMAEFIAVNYATAGLGNLVSLSTRGAKALSWYNGLRKGTAAQKFAYGTGQAFLEEAKTQVIGLDTGSGFAFSTFHQLAPLNFKKYLNPILSKVAGERAGVIVSSLADNLAGGTIRAGAAMEVAGLVEHVIKEKEFKNYLDENFQNTSQVGRRMFVQGLSMSWLGAKELFKSRTYYTAKEFGKELKNADLNIAAELRKTNPSEERIKNLNELKEGIRLEMQAQGAIRDMSDPKKLGELLKSETIKFDKEIAEANNNPNIDFKIQVTNTASENSGANSFVITPEGKLEITSTINAKKVLESATLKNGDKVSIMKNYSTVGHEGYHARNVIEAYKSVLKAVENNPKKVTEEAVREEIKSIVNRDYNKLGKASKEIKSRTGIDIENTEARVKEAYKDKQLTKAEIREETLAAVRDQIFNNVSTRKQSIFTTRRFINLIKNKFNIKGETESVNDFLEILDRLSNKNKKAKLENDIDVSIGATSSMKVAGEVVRKMEQKDLDALEKLKKEEIELELSFDNGEIEYDVYTQKLENLQIKRDVLNRQKVSTKKPVTTPKADKTENIGDAIKKLIPENITKKEYDRKYSGDVLIKLTETNMLDGVISNMMSRDGIVSDNIFGKTRQEFINEVKGKGKSNTFLKAILKFNPEQNDNLGGWVINSLRNRYKDALVLFKKQQVESQAKGIEDVKGLALESEVEAFESIDLSTAGIKETEAKEKSLLDRPTFKERGLVNESNESAIDSGLEKALTEMASIKYTTAKSKNKRKTEFLTDLMNFLKKDKPNQKIFKKTLPLKELFKGSNKDAIIENLSTFFLGGKTKPDGTVQGGMPFAIEKRVNGEFLKYPDWVGKKIDRESTSAGNAGRTSGNEITRRAPSSSVESIESAFAKRGSDLSLYDQMYRTSGMQRLLEILTKEDLSPSELKIRDAYDKVAETSEISYELFDATFKESVIRTMEQRDLPPEIVGQFFEKSGKLSEALFAAIGGTIKKTKEKQAIILQNNIKGLKPNQAESIVRSLLSVNRAFMKEEGRKIIERIKANKTLGKNQAKIFKNTLIEIDNTIKEKVLSKTQKGNLVNSKKQLTEKGKSLVENGNTYLKNIDKVKGNEAALNYFFAAYANPIRFDLPKKYINNQSILEIFPKLGSIKGLNLIKVPSGNTFFYDGKLKIDSRTGFGKSNILKPEAVKEYNKSTEYNLNGLLKEIDSKSDISSKFGVITNSFVQNLSTLGANLSKIKNIELDKNGKPIDVKNAVFEHNPPRTEIEAAMRMYSTGVISKTQLKALAEGWEVNLISKESDLLLAKNGFKQKGTAAERNELLINKGVRFSTIKDVHAKNPKPVRSMSQIDIPEGTLSKNLNEIIERNKGVAAETVYSDVVARRKGKGKGKFKFFLPSAAEDFRGLYYTLLGKSRQGEADKAFFENNLVKPYIRGVANMEKSKRALMNDYKTLKKTFKNPLKKAGIKKLNEDIPGTNITAEQALRIYLWDKSGFEVPGLTEGDKKIALDYMYSNPTLISYAESLQAISKKSEWSKPKEYWDAQSVLTDLADIALNVNRKQYLETFINNKNEVFSKENLNKLEAAYGPKYRDSLDDIMYRMENGTNKTFAKGTIADKWSNWLNNSIGSIMFLNRRSATLQLLSTINFVNTGDNNPLKAAAAFANQPQYWKDWAMIFNSAKLKERRGGLKSDVNEAEIAAAAAGSKNNPQAIISYLLQKGFVLTSIADSFAISTGGATFYRNRVNTYKKKLDSEGERLYSDKEAEAQAFEDFSLISDQTQQSGDPMMVSKQQADPIARVVLAFQNAPMQMTRFQKRDFQDLINRRRIEGKNQFQSDVTYLSRIGYYAFVQNLLFSALQNGLFTLMPGFEEEDGASDEKQQLKTEQKVTRTINSMVDTTLRGSGIYGAVTSTIKNVAMKYYEENQKSAYTKNNTKILLEAFNVAPPLGSKARKFYNALNIMDYEKDVIAERGFDITINDKFQLSPSYQVLGNLSASVANIPLDRITAEVDNVSELLDNRNSIYQRIALSLGWKGWEVGTEVEEHKLIKTKAKKERKEEGILKRKETAKRKRNIEIEANKNFTPEERGKYLQWKRNNKGKRLYDYLQQLKK